MKRVILESPYSGDVFVAYARACLRDSLMRGEAPIASHLLYTQDGVLNDRVLEERNQGIDAGHAWIEVADRMVVYIDRGVTTGMQRGIERAHDAGLIIVYRTLLGYRG